MPRGEARFSRVASSNFALHRCGRGIAADVMAAISSAGGWTSMQQALLAANNAGTIDAGSPDQITWLAPDAWQKRLY
jgi:hypothetical protein